MVDLSLGEKMIINDNRNKVLAPKPRPWVPYKPTQHAMQHRIDEIRKIPSLWTASTRNFR